VILPSIFFQKLRCKISAGFQSVMGAFGSRPPHKVRKTPFDGFFGATFDILKPRWLPTNMLGTVLSRIW
jgi:hypothetical protein